MKMKLKKLLNILVLKKSVDHLKRLLIVGILNTQEKQLENLLFVKYKKQPGENDSSGYFLFA